MMLKVSAAYDKGQVLIGKFFHYVIQKGNSRMAFQQMLKYAPAL